jgi:hypothetical protein
MIDEDNPAWQELIYSLQRIADALGTIADRL